MRRIATLLACVVVTGCQASRDVASADLDKATITRTAKTLSAIDRAERIVLDNIRCKDSVGHKRRDTRVDGDGELCASINFEQGSLESTGRMLDLAISGAGFFRVATGSAFAYTRCGNFFADKEGKLVLRHGKGYVRLDPPITLPSDSTDVRISQDGVVQVRRAGAAEQETAGVINLYRFAAPEQLSSYSSVFFLETDESGIAAQNRAGDDGAGTLQQTFLEESNVDLVQEELRLKELRRWRAALRSAVGLP